MHRIGIVVSVLLMFCVQGLPARAEDKAGQFDYYALVLSWSPTFCEGRSDDGPQCNGKRSYAFVLHGLWPQFEKGYPRDCASDAPKNVEVPLARAQLDIMPSLGLIGHEWRSHGTCSGLTQDAYFATLRAAREKIAIPAKYERLANWTSEKPDAVESAFLAANPGMQATGAAIICDRRFLSEIRICMTKSLGYRACPEVEKSSCRLAKAVMPPI